MKLNKIGAFFNRILKISMFIGVILLIGFYWILKKIQIDMNLFLGMIYPCGICFLILVYQFIKLFGMLKVNTPFSSNTVTYLKKGMYTSFVITILVAIAFLFLFRYEFYTLGIKLCVGFICILFLGVGIALYILKELFKEALEYKEENDLTI